MIDEDNYTEVQQMFTMLCKRFNEVENQVNICDGKIQALENSLDSYSLAASHLLLGSVSTQIMIKIGK